MKLPLIAFLFLSMLPVVRSEPVPVELIEKDGYHLLFRAGEPYFIRGAGGSENLELLADTGGNSVRTWGRTDRDFLDRAHEAGLTVCVGLWIEHERHGFDYGDKAAVAAQVERHKETIDRLKDHPAVLLWGIGNEVELEYTDPRVWDVVEAVAAYARKVDPHHPTMTVTSHVDHEVVAEILKRCPSIDILGSNSYGGLRLLSEAIVDAGWEGPYIVTEWGPNGTWEVEKTAWGAEIEPSSTEKARQLAIRHSYIAGDRERCLGGYFFLWGWKQESTPTWFSLFTKDGRMTAGLEVLRLLWSREPPEHEAPRIAGLHLNGLEPEDSLTVAPDEPMQADFMLARGDPAAVELHWEVLPESTDKGVGGDEEEKPEPVSFDTRASDGTRLIFHAPEKPGPYRLYLYVKGPGRTVATANFPFLVK